MTTQPLANFSEYYFQPPSDSGLLQGTLTGLITNALKQQGQNTVGLVRAAPRYMSIDLGREILSEPYDLGWTLRSRSHNGYMHVPAKSIVSIQFGIVSWRSSDGGPLVFPQHGFQYGLNPQGWQINREKLCDSINAIQTGDNSFAGTDEIGEASTTLLGSPGHLFRAKFIVKHHLAATTNQ